MDVTAFVIGSLPQSPTTVLEVGCGEGELALQLAGSGHVVTAIDPEAPTGEIFRRVSLEGFHDRATFQAIVANRSLHHIHDLHAALVKISSLLEPDGALILNEFAWDKMDEKTAAWYLSKVDEPAEADASLLPENFPGMWVEEHDGLHTSSSMRTELDSRFQTQLFEEHP